MSMRLRDKFRVLALGLLLAFTAAFAVAASATSFAEAGTTLSQAALQPDFGESAPEHSTACFERHDPCKPGSVAVAAPTPATVHAMPGGGFVKAPAFRAAPMRDVAPHAAASLSILFRNFRE